MNFLSFVFSKFYYIPLMMMKMKDSNFEAFLTSPYDWESSFLWLLVGFVHAGSVCKSHYE